MKHTTCPTCKGTDLEDFFTIRNAPVHSIATMKSYEEAIKVPRKDIELTFCNRCGLVFNSAFDTSIDHFSQGYEDQQGFSPTFVKFITGVTERFIEKYDIRNKQVVEIGCGKGDFINLISRLGNNKGVGIDPAYVPGRGEQNPDVRFIRELYSESHGGLQPDCITCRHTLEHIHDTSGFIGIIRSSIKDAKPILFFEVPCIVRILEIQAFWDIFYEHCTYLSPGSIARLFRLNDFEVLDMHLEYDNQYLFIEAKPVGSRSDRIHPLEEPIEELRAKTKLFSEKVNAELAEWRDRLCRFREEDKRVVVWGGGSKCVGFLTQFDELGVIEHVVDINPHMQGNYIPGIGKQYVDPEFLESYRPDVIIVMNSVYMDEIQESLSDRRLHPQMLGL